MKACKLADGKISQQKLNLAEKMLKAKFTPEAISEVLTRSSDKNGNIVKNILDDYVKHYNELSAEDKRNLKAINLKQENGILRQTMTFNDGSIRVFDIDDSKIENKD